MLGPWGSLVSFVLGVYVTPVQIRTGPLIPVPFSCEFYSYHMPVLLRVGIVTAILSVRMHAAKMMIAPVIILDICG